MVVPLIFMVASLIFVVDSLIFDLSFMQWNYFVALNLSSVGGCGVGLLFTNEEHGKLTHDVVYAAATHPRHIHDTVTHYARHIHDSDTLCQALS